MERESHGGGPVQESYWWYRKENFEVDTFDYNGYKAQKGKSIAHKWIATEKAVYISLDIDTGGENCGIIELSAQIFSYGPA